MALPSPSLALRLKTGRQAEARDRHGRYYAQHNHPNQSTFGVPEYVDVAGRQYRIAYRQPAGLPPGAVMPPRPPTTPAMRDGVGRVGLWVKQRRGTPSREAWDLIGKVVTLDPVQPGLPALTIRVDSHTAGAVPRERTGTVYVTSKSLNALLSH